MPAVPLPREMLLAVSMKFPPRDFCRGQVYHFPLALGFCSKLWMTQKPTNQRSCFQHRTCHYDDAKVRVTKAATEEPQIAGEERWLLHTMQVAKNLLLVPPFRATDLISDLPKVNAPASKLLRLIFSDVVIK